MEAAYSDDPDPDPEGEAYTAGVAAGVVAPTGRGTAPSAASATANTVVEVVDVDEDDTRSSPGRLRRKTGARRAVPKFSCPWRARWTRSVSNMPGKTSSARKKRTTWSGRPKSRLSMPAASATAMVLPPLPKRGPAAAAENLCAANFVKITILLKLPAPLSKPYH